jgi:REP element-mobilizing transposase RayT
MSKYNPAIHNRRSIRLKGYDYSRAGLYFITICCQDRACLFGKINDRKMILNQAGQMIEMQWQALPDRFKNIDLHAYIVMPNHFHAILEIVNVPTVRKTTIEVGCKFTDSSVEGLVNESADKSGEDSIGESVGASLVDAYTHCPTLGDIIGAFHSIVTVEYIRGVKDKGWTPFNGKLFQRNYYEHIIRDERSYQTISQYITDNPAKWENDKLNTLE